MAGGESTLIADPVGVPLARLLVQFVVILVSVRFLGWMLKKVKQPIVIGEILAGILLGPSAFGNIPGFTAKLFPNDKAFATASVAILGLFAQIGLIFFMFFLGMEVDGPMMKRSSRQAFPIAMASILVPFGIGAAMAPYLYGLDGGSGDYTSFILFVGTALSFTAFPVLARILSSTNMMKTPLGVLALACAAVNDVLAWCTLAITLSYAAGGNVVNGIYTTLIACGFVLFMVLALRPVLERVHKYYLDHKDEKNRNLLALLFCLLCICSWFAEIVGIHAFFGAFLFGIVVPRQGHLIHEIAPKIELLVVEFFLPLYFANSGLRTDIKGLTGSMWLAALAFTVAGTVGKIIPVLLASKRFGWDWRESWTMGVLMNTRGLVALIVLNIALDNKIISVNSFTILVIMALVTTFMTSPLLDYFYLRVRPVEQQLAAAAAKASHAGVTAAGHTSAAELNAQAVHHEKPSATTPTAATTIPLASIGHEAKSTKPPSPTLSDHHHHSSSAAASSLGSGSSQARLSNGRTLKVSPSMESLNQAANGDSTIDIDHVAAPLNPQPQAQPQGGFVSLVAEDRSISTRLPPLSAVHWRVIEGSIQPSNN